MNSKEQLVSLTNEFFSRHWGFSETPPAWDFSWDFKGAVPNYLVGGIYALLKEGKVYYLGLGNSRGGGIYLDRGISRRLMNHVIRNAPKNSEVSYVLRDRWAQVGIDKIGTLGFEQGRNYLAPALEDYLIATLHPQENNMKRVFV